MKLFLIKPIKKAPSYYNDNWSFLVRKKITVTEGEGL